MKTLDVPEIEIRRTNVLQCADADVVASGPEAVLPLLREILSGREQESFIILMLDARNRVTAWREVARGSASHVEVPVREIFGTALMSFGLALILCHNHPSGDPSPSAADNFMTAKLKEVGELIGITIVDHIIIGSGDRYYSFAHGSEAATPLLINAPRHGPELD